MGAVISQFSPGASPQAGSLSHIYNTRYRYRHSNEGSLNTQRKEVGDSNTTARVERSGGETFTLQALAQVLGWPGGDVIRVGQ